MKLIKRIEPVQGDGKDFLKHQIDTMTNDEPYIFIRGVYANCQARCTVTEMDAMIGELVKLRNSHYSFAAPISLS